MSLYKDFVEEVTLFNIVETDDYFFSYLINNDVFMIKNLYIRSDKRNTMLGYRIKCKLFELAKKLGCKTLCGEICMVNPYNQSWLSFFERSGFTIYNSTGDGSIKLAFKEVR